MRFALSVLAAGLIAAAACASHSSSATATTASATTTDTIGKFVWHDLMTDDVLAAKLFYGGLLGWQFTETTRLGRTYLVASYRGHRVGGVVSVDAAPGREVSQWIGYESVRNVDDAVAAVGRAGGHTLVAPVEVGSTGRAAVVSDPQGAALGLLRLTGGDPADPASPAAHTFFWMDYLARDPAAAASFYPSTFGYQRSVTDRAGAAEYVVLSHGRPRAGILQMPTPDMRPTWLCYLLVDDPAALAAKVPALGGTVLLAPRADIRRGSVAVVTDPSGAMVALQKYPF